MTTIILIRHGESEANEKNMFAGYSDQELTARGRRQAELTAKFVATVYPADVVYSSDLKRAFFTGKAVADALGLEIKTDKGLREINGGEWEEVRFRELSSRYAEYSVGLQCIRICC